MLPVNAVMPTLGDMAHVLGWLGVVLIVAVILGAFAGVFDAALGDFYVSWPGDDELSRRQTTRPVLYMAVKKEMR